MVRFCRRRAMKIKFTFETLFRSEDIERKFSFRWANLNKSMLPSRRTQTPPAFVICFFKIQHVDFLVFLCPLIYPDHDQDSAQFTTFSFWIFASFSLLRFFVDRSFARGAPTYCQHE